MVPSKSFSRILKLNKKGRSFRPFLYTFAGLFPAVAIAQAESQLSLELRSVSYSEASSIHSISGRWSDRVTTGDQAWSSSRLTLGYQQRSYQLQMLYRNDTYYRFANDTARIIYLAENALELQTGHVYPLTIIPDKISSKGFRFGFNTDIDNDFKLSAFVSLLKPTDLLQGHLGGRATAVAANDYDFSFASDVVYADDPLYDRVTKGISGSGYALDLKLDYRMNEKWAVQLELLDVAGKLTIDEAPTTIANASSLVKTYDDNGYLTYNPVISGIEGYKSVVHELDIQTHLSLSYQLRNSDKLILQHHDLLGLTYQRMIYSQQINQHQVNWQLIPELKALGVKYTNPFISIGIEADNLNYKKMHFFSIHASAFWSF